MLSHPTGSVLSVIVGRGSDGREEWNLNTSTTGKQMHEGFETTFLFTFLNLTFDKVVARDATTYYSSRLTDCFIIKPIRNYRPDKFGLPACTHVPLSARTLSPPPPPPPPPPLPLPSVIQFTARTRRESC
ncbi:hypothetical protein LSTR_LSTR002857 [Laodelphax striatellus]|uniref:Uncharacterized protein n=1 Tax=Laodelphax striatellus TaxID=195883 RepID=A0A482XIB9_LAOST|nr:hypothetical protein LSTR_LSTR002857 [Laodelphax striatellus]